MPALFDLPKPAISLILHKCDDDAKQSLRQACRATLLAVDSECGVQCCVWARAPSQERLETISRISEGIRALLLPNTVTAPQGWPCRSLPLLTHLVVNYRLASLCRELAAAAGSSLTRITITQGGTRKGTRWVHKHCRLLRELQHLPQLRRLSVTLGLRPASAEIVGRLSQLHCLQLSVSGPSIADTFAVHPEQIFDQQLWRLAVQPHTGLTRLQLALPLLVPHEAEADDFLRPLQQLRCLQLHLLRDLGAEEQHPGGRTGPLAAARLLGSFPPLQHVTRLQVVAPCDFSWSHALDRELDQDTFAQLGQLQQLGSLELSLARWQVSLRDLQPLTACRHLTELVLPELVLSLADRDLDQGEALGSSQLTEEEMAAVAAAMAAAAASAASAAASEAGTPANEASSSAGGGRRSSCGSPGRSKPPASPAAAEVTCVPAEVSVFGMKHQVPLLPGLRRLACKTLYWRLPLVLLAPGLQDVTYKRLRNLGHGSYILPDLQEWEQDHFGGGGLQQALQQALLQPGDNPEGGGAAVLNLINHLFQDFPEPAGAAEPGDAAAQGAAAVLELMAQFQGPVVFPGDAEAAAAEALMLPPPPELHFAAAEDAAAAGGAAAEHFFAEADDAAGAAEGAAGAAEGAAEAAEGAAGAAEGAAGAAEGAAGAAEGAAEAAEGAAGDQPALEQAQGAGPSHAAAAPAAVEAPVAHLPEPAAWQQQQEQQQEQEDDGHESLWDLFQQQSDEEEVVTVNFDAYSDLDSDDPAAAAADGGAGPAAPQAEAAGDAAVIGGGGGFWAEHDAAVMNPWLPLAQAADAAEAAEAAPAAPAVLQEAPLSKVYGDVLRGQTCLQVLDVCVTALCKVARLSSMPLARLQHLRLHMLGVVKLPAGGLPLLPCLTHLEFYLPDERNWESNYNDDEDLALWQNQRILRQVTVRGTSHAGGFFAPQHLAKAAACLPALEVFRFVSCRDLRADRLQRVLQSRVAPRVEVVMPAKPPPATPAKAAGGGTAAGAAGAAGGAGHGAGHGDAGGSSCAAAGADDGDADSVDSSSSSNGSSANNNQHSQEPGPSSSSSGGGHGGGNDVIIIMNEHAGVHLGGAGGQVGSAAAAAADADDARPLSDSESGSFAPYFPDQPVTKAVVVHMAAAAAAAGVELQWIDHPVSWSSWLAD